MGLLVGLPLKLFYLLFSLLRFALPILVVIGVIWLLRRRKQGGGQTHDTARKHKEPDFSGPVYTVDYKEVDEDEGQK